MASGTAVSDGMGVNEKVGIVVIGFSHTRPVKAGKANINSSKIVLIRAIEGRSFWW